MKALTFSNFGGPEVLEYKEIASPVAGENEVLIKMKAIGLNYADIYRRRGNYHLKGNPPFLAGYEGAGIVLKSNSKNFLPGDRVGFADVPYANAEYVKAPEEKLIKLPEDISFENAASILLQGLTAQFLSEESYSIKENDFVVIHAAAGGVGQILTQLAKIKNAQVIGLSRKKEKLDIIKENGAAHAILLNQKWEKEVFKITNHGANVVYDSVGNTLNKSLAVTREGGTTVFFGMSGGDPKPIDPRYLMDRSLKLVGGDLWGYIKSPVKRRKKAANLFSLFRSGKIKIKEPVKFRLEEGRKAHEFLEFGNSNGKVLLIP
ncbi:quinone oxidoreductase [Christiangramia fulva]|uniref:Quinone oxidoreductase n=1 Tax=Christiangramia fulva TaxID=2126553 RepID=A0A2R3Z2E9_9FLAO|nr:quinone oxidoreductase [Christiangramia fulva]AVR44453.1 quinone oxidoreductase [Christiangramia fulva]